MKMNMLVNTGTCNTTEICPKLNPSGLLNACNALMERAAAAMISLCSSDKNSKSLQYVCKVQ